jgi:hypothetical protein
MFGKIKYFFLIIFFSCATQAKEGVAKALPIAKVSAAFPVNFALYTFDKNQYVAFYDTVFQMTLAVRTLPDSVWDYAVLDSKVAWDSHNYLSLMIDKEGFIHLVGNMHSSKLIYFRSSRPYDIHSMQALHRMTGNEEDITTYPEFMYKPDGGLLFHYRYGHSGSGYEVYNYWNFKTHDWERFIEKPLIDGLGKRNAYMQGPSLGTDGYYHLIWVWRDSPDCSTNHTLSYVRSKDLLHWESIRGETVSIPITLAEESLYVDTTPIKGGLINIGIKLGFDSQNKVLIGYHKYDSAGNTQLFITRFENNHWKSNQLTHWNYRWDFKGMGTIKNELLIEAPKTWKTAGQLQFAYHHTRYGDGQVIVNEKTLKAIDILPIETSYPNEVDIIRSAIPGVVVNKIFDKGHAVNGMHYLLRWETFPPNRDQAPTEVDKTVSILEIIQY